MLWRASLKHAFAVHAVGLVSMSVRWGLTRWDGGTSLTVDASFPADFRCHATSCALFFMHARGFVWPLDCVPSTRLVRGC